MKISNDEFLRRLREGKETALKFNAFVTAGAYDRLIKKAEDKVEWSVLFFPANGMGREEAKKKVKELKKKSFLVRLIEPESWEHQNRYEVKFRSIPKIKFVGKSSRRGVKGAG